MMGKIQLSFALGVGKGKWEVLISVYWHTTISVFPIVIWIYFSVFHTILLLQYKKDKPTRLAGYEVTCYCKGRMLTEFALKSTK